MSNRIYVALDTPDLDRAKTIATKVRQHVGGIKLGLEFFTANGRHGVREMGEIGLPIFLDLKLHDIPNTVAKAVMALRGLEPAILTVHAAGGRAMLEDAKAAAPTGTKVVAVTMLTSLDASDLAATGISGSAHDQVVPPDRTGDERRASTASSVRARKSPPPRNCGRRGSSSSPASAPPMAWSATRSASLRRAPRSMQALRSWSIGRPITQAENPDQAARAIESTL